MSHTVWWKAGMNYLFLVVNESRSLYTYINTFRLFYLSLVWFGFWHINPYWLFNARSSLYIYIKYIWFGLVGFYDISTIVGYFMQNRLYIYIYIKYIGFGLVGFYGISSIVGYLMPSPLYTYILKIYDLLTHFVDNIFKRRQAHSFALLNGFKFFNLT